MTDADRALRAYTDVLAVEWDDEAGVARIVTLGDVYTAVPEEGLHLCPDREYHDVDRCKHVIALDAVRGRLDIPTGWLTVDNLDERTDPTFPVNTDLPDFEDFRVMADGGLPAWATETQTLDDGTMIRCTKCGSESSELPVDHKANCPYSNDIVADGGQVERSGNTPEGHDQWVVWDPELLNAHVFDKRPAAEDRQEKAATEFDVDADLYPPGESPEEMYHGDEDVDVRYAGPSPPTDDSDDDPDTETDGGAQEAEPVEPCAHSGEPEPIPEADAEPVEGEVVDHAPDDGPDPAPAPDTHHEPEALSPDEIEQYADDLDEREVGQDPLQWMPGEFVDTIDGSQAINRKGFEVLRFFYDVSLSMEMEVDPEDNDMTHCRYKCEATMDGDTVEAWGTSHVERGDDPWLLVEMAATRARKRAISIATGAGAIAVEELKNEVQG